MYSDLTVEELSALRTQIRDAWHQLICGQQPADIRYGDKGEKFHPADTQACRVALAEINAEIARRNGCRSGGFTVVHGG